MKGNISKINQENHSLSQTKQIRGKSHDVIFCYESPNGQFLKDIFELLHNHHDTIRIRVEKKAIPNSFIFESSVHGKKKLIWICLDISSDAPRGNPATGKIEITLSDPTESVARPKFPPIEQKSKLDYTLFFTSLSRTDLKGPKFLFLIELTDSNKSNKLWENARIFKFPDQKPFANKLKMPKQAAPPALEEPGTPVMQYEPDPNTPTTVPWKKRARTPPENDVGEDKQPGATKKSAPQKAAEQVIDDTRNKIRSQILQNFIENKLEKEVESVMADVIAGLVRTHPVFQNEELF